MIEAQRGMDDKLVTAVAELELLADSLQQQKCKVCQTHRSPPYYRLLAYFSL
jgi:hypothetical protein